MAEDEHAGLGGSYIIAKDGVRRLVERTEEPDRAANDKPAKAPRKPRRPRAVTPPPEPPVTDPQANPDGGDATDEQKGE